MKLSPLYFLGKKKAYTAAVSDSNKYLAIEKVCGLHKMILYAVIGLSLHFRRY